MSDTVYELLRFYRNYAINWWNHIGPVEYVVLLSLVGIFGYMMMLKTPKHTG